MSDNEKTTAPNRKRIYILSRTAKETRNYRVYMKTLTILLVMLIIVTSVLYVVAVLYKRTGSFTVSLDKYEMTKYGLTLSESRDMINKNSRPTF